MRELRVMEKQRVILENFWAFFEPNTHIGWEKGLKKEGCGKPYRVNGDNLSINILYTQSDVISNSLRKKFPTFPQTWLKLGKNTLSEKGRNLDIVQFYLDSGFNKLWLESTTSMSYPQRLDLLQEYVAYHHGLMTELSTLLNGIETVEHVFESFPNLFFTYTLIDYPQLNNKEQLIFTVEQLIHRHKTTKAGFALVVNENKFSKSHSNASTLASLFVEVYSYIDFFTENNLKVEDLFPHFTFIIKPEDDYFLSISKHIALRMLWDDFCSCYTDKHYPAVLYTDSALQNDTNKDEQHNNLLRMTMHAMSSIQGGSNGMFLTPTGLLDGKADQRLSVNLGHLLETESLLTQYRHAAEGTYYIEYLTHSLYTEAKEELFKRIGL